MASFKVADDIFLHLRGVVPGVPDPLLASKYAGFAAVSAVAIYEVNIKLIITDFCRTKHRVFGDYAGSKFDRINGRIKLSNLTDEYINPFGQRYKDRWKRNLDREEASFQRLNRRSLKASYANVINWRNEFAHSGGVPMYATFAEVLQAYEDGKGIVLCFERSLRR